MISAAVLAGLITWISPCTYLSHDAIFPTRTSSSLRQLVPVRLTVDNVDYIYCVAPDYYAGKDGIRRPMGLQDVNKLLSNTDFQLPTKALVDAIWKQADIKLKPVPLPANKYMAAWWYVIKHNSIIEQQLYGINLTGKLIAGDKKDIIKQAMPNRVTIYGWQRKSGRPIQPVSSVHASTYFDYSHGIRLVAKTRFRVINISVDLHKIDVYSP